MIKSKATVALMRLKEIDKKYKVRYNDQEKNESSSENTKSSIDDHLPKKNNLLGPSIPVEQKILKSTLSIKIPDACSEHFESRSSTSDNNVSMLATTAFEKTSDIISFKGKTQHSEGSEKSRRGSETYVNQKSENTKDIEQLESIDEYMKTRSVTETEKSQSITEIDEVLDDNESVSEILDRSDTSNSKSLVKSENKLLLISPKDSFAKNQSKDNSSSQSSKKSEGYSNDSFESFVSEAESSRRSKSHKSPTQSLSSRSDTIKEEKSSSSSNRKFHKKINDNSFRQIVEIDIAEGISNLSAPSVSQGDELLVASKVFGTSAITSDDNEKELSQSEKYKNKRHNRANQLLEALNHSTAVTKESGISIKKLEPLEIGYDSSNEGELLSSEKSHSERSSETLGNHVRPPRHEKSSNSSECLASVRSVSDSTPNILKMVNNPNELENDKSCIESVNKGATKLYRNQKVGMDLSCSRKHLKKYRKEDSESSSISQNKLKGNAVNTRQKHSHRHESPMKPKAKFRRSKSNFVIETERNKLPLEKDSTVPQTVQRQLGQDIKMSQSMRFHQSSRKTKFPSQHNRELQSLKKQMNNLRIEQEREAMLFYIRNFDEDKRRLLLWPSQLNNSGKPEIPILKPLDFPNVANFKEPDSTAGESSLRVDIDGELLKNRIVEIRRWLKDQFILYRDYCDVAAAINAKYAEEQKEIKASRSAASRSRRETLEVRGYR
ncbi:uncharacterized protein [Venturia canescens]|uniref:uncharacterized protein isoform X2 n=1 Tax=Venturia canescens TaxID=32260 RepID=UPI001C9D0C7A|nr:uncharacterized protein LOC122411743 isoform X2 [Venturia canescens]